MRIAATHKPLRFDDMSLDRGRGHIVCIVCGKPSMLNSALDRSQTTSLPLTNSRRRLQTNREYALGRDIGGAFSDPDVVEFMSNPDGRLFI